ncbi:bifunctional tRNA (5-methylaminomethyl-2-thiouridine)(34)-methyltransferase MnmD/FAD-dependent 5-carboxymethylaminomethyl-2-thiouridine(34) oxidoreductase MnmC [Caballeronia sp. LZ016]|uniref:bifunctional tRNA (5-methylaminomethyl-2-thiouridine)(34)-methyltransferase MnmD/FAD-dependent 5-carboxymethylaminomethyl-2-thiouridine(34) oxidoreductase MnmC n=1 Tax=Caballeronia sp. LZ016 TaxID=3038554 RepID=UPI0028603282|nr:bifunctional tRNA (5-methylaminomethyl-2-thiouridine)(34)-methyltransferase MnmD/FAD-dependent 5-carboxymethylaminomethyl-2-thiouridine(34) oxidoreductase MnmC [Caballeronia sp. LZ016]MDR5737099.1 bifunctional tRNA (5-methylaminomethyl-2-thiouridine)(34)-methyltransferase MnmD/FAD-dependent 5-carboxymethylaminomethyl-2-thiouridine(34) oxidoreductase MnmC [Caballeronia sp. LZ016]
MTDCSPLLAFHDLPARWKDKRIFTFLAADAGNGSLKALLAVWRRWRESGARSERLHLVATVPPTVPEDDDALAAELGDALPIRTPGLHRLEFDAGRVVLTLAIGNENDMLPKLWLRADAMHFDASQHDDPRKLCKTLARFAADDATLSASAAEPAKAALLKALAASGFDCNATSDGMTGRFAPRWRVRRHEPPVACHAPVREAIVIGAGLAGCAMTSALASRGWRVTLIDRHASPALDASGNPAGVFHPIVWRDDSIAARLTRAGFLHALRRWPALEAAGHDLQRSVAGLLQIADTPEDADALAAAIERFGYPREYVTAMTRDAASRAAGVDVARGGWFFPHGGSISPAAVCAAQLAAAGDALTARMNTEVARIEQDGRGWQAFDAGGALIAKAPVVVLANARDAARLAGLHGEPTRGVRGQLSILGASPLDALRVPVIGDGYAVPLGNGRTLIGATYDIDDTDPHMRDAGHRENIERVGRMLPALRDVSASQGRVAFRCVTSDRMPMIGQLADETAARRDAQRLSGAWPLDLARVEGLYGAFAFGSRGLVWAALAAELIASQIGGEPWPIERELAEAIDPARFLLRALRHGEITAA